MTDETQGRAIVPAEARAPRVYQNVEEAVALLDTSRFEHLQRIATVMATSTLVPDCLRGDVKGDNFTAYPLAVAISNCFLVVEQAVRWNMSPFAVAQCCSIVHGRLMYEGKLVSAVLQSRLSIDLTYEFGRWDPKTETTIVGDEGQGDLLAVLVSGIREGERPRVVMGSVGTWKTEGKGSPWRPGAMKRQLRYRGAREWSRAHEPGVMLGVITEDEMDDLVDRRFARAATSAPRLTSGFEDAAAPALEAPRTAGEPEAPKDAAQASEASDASSSAEETVDQKTGEITEKKKRAPRAAKPVAIEPEPQPEPEPIPPEDAGPGEPSAEETTTQSQPTSAASPDASNPFDVAIERIGEATSWLGAKQAIKTLIVTPEWKGAGPDQQESIRAAAWARFSTLQADGKDDTDITDDITLMRMWLEFGATSEMEIEGLWPSFWRKAVFKTASAADQKGITGLMIARKAALKGAP